jgi:hypothetical protein
MKKLTEFFENPVIESRLRFVFRAAVLLSMLVILFIAATSKVSAQPAVDRSYQALAINEPRESAAVSYLQNALNRFENSPAAFITNDQNDGQVKIKMYPDPVSGYLLVLFPMLPFNSSIKVISTDGRILTREVIFSGASSTVLDVKNFPKGPYILIFENKKEKELIKFLKS